MISTSDPTALPIPLAALAAKLSVDPQSLRSLRLGLCSIHLSRAAGYLVSDSTGPLLPHASCSLRFAVVMPLQPRKLVCAVVVAAPSSERCVGEDRSGAGIACETLLISCSTGRAGGRPGEDDDGFAGALCCRWGMAMGVPIFSSAWLRHLRSSCRIVTSDVGKGRSGRDHHP